MTKKELLLFRLANLQVTLQNYSSPHELVNWLGAVQAQDVRMVLHALKIRLDGADLMKIKTDLNLGKILRTHILRPTWHIVSAEDISWMLDLTAPRIRTAMKSRHKQLEISDQDVHKSNELITRLLEGGNHLTRNELLDQLTRANIPVENNRGYHLLLRAELDKVICSGRIKDDKQTYALMAERIPATGMVPLDEATSLYRIATKYFQSHGPASLQDFVWWSGLTMRQARQGLESARSAFAPVDFEGETYWYKESSVPPLPKQPLLLPGYDEFIIGYRDKSFAIAPETTAKIIHSNGVFRPFRVEDGLITDIWQMDK